MLLIGTVLPDTSLFAHIKSPYLEWLVGPFLEKLVNHHGSSHKGIPIVCFSSIVSLFL